MQSGHGAYGDEERLTSVISRSGKTVVSVRKGRRTSTIAAARGSSGGSREQTTTRTDDDNRDAGPGPFASGPPYRSGSSSRRRRRGASRRIYSVAVAATFIAGCTSVTHRGTATSPSPSSTRPGARLLKIDASSGCPPIARGNVQSLAPGSSAEMVPPRPNGALACRYGGITPNGEKLAKSARIAGPSADRIASLIDKLHAARGAVACPYDSGARDVLVFTYPGAAEAEVEVHLSGCTTVTNGHMAAVASPELLSMLAAAVGKPG